MERSKRTTSGTAGGVVATPSVARGAPQLADVGDWGSAAEPPPEDAPDGAAAEAGSTGEPVEVVRAGPWEPDAALMEALGLGEEPLSEDDARREAAAEPAAETVKKIHDRTTDGQPPWW